MFLKRFMEGIIFELDFKKLGRDQIHKNEREEI